VHILSIGKFPVLDIVFPTSVYGISAFDAMAEWWGVKIDFNPSSVFFEIKLGIMALSIAGVIFVLRMLCIRKGWSAFGFRDKYLAQLRADGRTPAADGLVTDLYPEFSQDGATAPLNYELIEAVFFYAFCTFAFHGLFDPLFSFYRYTGAMIGFFAVISIQNRISDNTPAMAMWAVFGAMASNIAVFIVLLYDSYGGAMPAGLVDSTIITLNWQPEMYLNIALIVVVIALYFKYYYAIKASQYAKSPSSPNLKKITIYLSVMCLILCFFNFYMP
jgi:hypothetical protein